MPTYTSDLCTGGIPFANCINNSSESQAQLVDDNLGTKWLTFNPTFSVSNLFVRNQLSGGAKTVVSYSITSAEDHPERDLNGWVLEGSNNGTTWTTLDTRSQISWLSRFEVRVFNFTNATAYAYYRFNFTSLAGPSGNATTDASSHVCEIKLYTGTNATGTEVGQGGTATASNAAINAASNAFDNNNYTKWEATGSSWTLGSPIGWWFGYKFASAKAIAQYTITSANDADERDPQDWLFQYSDDDATWTTANTQTAQDFAGRGLTKTYQFTSPGAHLYWRVLCTKRGDSATGGLMQVAEMEMMEEVGGGPSPITGTIAVTEASDTAAINGTVGTAGITGTLATTEAKDTAAIVGGPIIPASPVFVPGHSLLTNMLACYLPGVYGGVPVQSVGPTLANGAGGAGTVVSTLEGPASRSNTLGSAKGLTATAPTAFKSWTNFTVMWRGLVIGTGDAFCPIVGVSIGDTDVVPYFMLNVSGNSASYVNVTSYYGDGTGSETTGNFDASGLYGKVVDFVATATVGGSVTFYVNGAAVSGTGSLTTISTSSSTSKIVVNQGIDATSRSPNASVNMACFWNRALSGAEVLALHDNPYGFLQSGVYGTLAATEAADTALINGSVGAVGITGTLATTEAPDTALISGTTAWNAALAATEANDTALISGATRWNAALAATETPDTALINGATRWNATLATTEASDTALINGATRWNAAMAATEAADTALIQGTATTIGEAAGSLNALEAADTALINGTVTGIAGTLVASEALDTALINGAVRWNAALAASEAPDTALVNGAVRWNATLAASEAPDTTLITGTTAWNAILAAIEASDIVLIQGTVAAPTVITGTLNAQEAADTALISGTLGALGITGTLNAQEARDTALLTGTLGLVGTLNAQEAPDTALIVGNLVLPQLTGILAATEAPDTARITGYTELTGLPGVLTFGRTVVINRW